MRRELNIYGLHRCEIPSHEEIYEVFDQNPIRSDHLTIGMKGLLDALKVRTSGRREGIYLHYFGAIVDDAPDFVDVSYEQELVTHPREAGVSVRVLPKRP
jgi:hypothetical protein